MTTAATDTKSKPSDHILIDLDLPQDGINASSDMNFYEAELQLVLGWVLETARATREYYATKPAKPDPRRSQTTRREIPHSRRAILIEGERGIGKTSFLLTLRERLNDPDSDKSREKSKDEPRIHVLPLLDPTLIDGDRVFVASVLSNLVRELEDRGLLRGGCGTRGDDSEKFRDALQQLHHGLLASSDQTWDALMSHGSSLPAFTDSLMKMAKGGLLFADQLEHLARAACDLLGVDMLVQPLDDVDNAGPEAWRTLEVIRKHLTGPSLLPVVAGSMDQFFNTTWEERLKSETQGSAALKTINEEEHKRRLEQVRNDALQHLDKLFHPARRMALRSKRSILLREALIRTKSPRNSSPGRSDSGSEQLRNFLRRAEGSLFGLSEDRILGKINDLVPNNTRRMVELLRTWDQLAVVGDYAILKESPHRWAAFLRTAGLHESTLHALGANSQILESLAREGVTPSNVALVRRAWPAMTQELRRGQGGVHALRAGGRLTEVALSMETWTPARVVRFLLGPAMVIAHYRLFVDTTEARSETDRTSSGQLSVDQSGGLAELVELMSEGNSPRVLMAWRTSQQPGVYRRPIGWWLNNQKYPSPTKAKPLMGLNFFRQIFQTRVRAQGGASALLDPLRALEHIGNFLVPYLEFRTKPEGTPPADRWARVWWNGVEASHSAYYGSEAVNSKQPSASTAPQEDTGESHDGGEVGSTGAIEQMLQALTEWAITLVELEWSPRALLVPTLAHRYAVWMEAFRKAGFRILGIDRNKRYLAGPFLERAVLGFIHATMCVELSAYRDSLLQLDMKNLSESVRVWLDTADGLDLESNLLTVKQPETAGVKDGEGAASSSLNFRAGIEDLFRLVRLAVSLNVGNGRPDARSNSEKYWMALHAPFSLLWVSCPVFRALLHKGETGGWNSWFENECKVRGFLPENCESWGNELDGWGLSTSSAKAGPGDVGAEVAGEAIRV